MRFQTKMILTYAVMMFVFALILSIGYYEYSISKNKEDELRALNVSADQLIVQCDEMLKPMELTMSYILSDVDMLHTIYILSNQKDHYLDFAELNAQSSLREGLNTDFIVNNFYRTIVFNQLGYITSSINISDRSIKKNFEIKDMPWLSYADSNAGKPVIVSSHPDSWSARKTQVFSLVKAIQGNNMGYIEVQKKLDDLKSQIILQNNEQAFLILVNGDELLYTNQTKLSLSDLNQLIQMNKNDTEVLKLSEQKTYFISKSTSKNYSLSVMVMTDASVIEKNNVYLLFTTLVVLLVFFSISMVFVWLFSHFLTRPIRQLKIIMEKTEIENMKEALPDDLIDKTSNNEIQALQLSYQNVLERLQESMIKEKRMSILQLQAQFDLLQSQVNPHFLYNVLNVIAARGVENQDEKICEICGSLANMLRYSTNTKRNNSTVREELDYLEQYFYLLKARFEHKINFKIEVPNEIMNQIIPKITLQQIVENCINHGFENSTREMEVNIKGEIRENRWTIRIYDNGQGFPETVLMELYENFRETKNRLFNEKSSMHFEIGGMGLVNTYARLLLLYKEDLEFKLENTENGAVVIIESLIQEGKYV